MDRIRVSKLNESARIAALIGAVLSCAITVSAQEHDLRLQITWGGGARRLWQGSISVDNGSLGRARSLGIEADAATLLDVDEKGIRFAQHTPVTFDGLDLPIQAAAAATLAIELTSDPKSGAARRVEIPLSKFALEPEFTYKSQLDDQQNWLLVRRAPGDQLRVDVGRDHMVFAPGEQMTFRVQPHLLGLPANTSLRCSMELRNRNGDREWSSEPYDLTARADGGTADIGPVSVDLPAVEGVYELSIQLSERRFPDAIGVLIPSKPVTRRTVQLAVVGPQPLAIDSTAWRELDVIDLTSREWWKRWMWLPGIEKLPGMDQVPLGKDPEPFGAGQVRKRVHLDKEVTEISGGAWYAAPIPIERMGQPHIIELEYPNDIRQTLGISILETNAAGALTPLGLDSGIDVPERPAPPEPALERHRLIFWPRTKTPWLLLTNRRSEDTAMFGRIRVLSGPQRLPAMPFAEARADERMLAVYFDKPLFTENFSAPEALDERPNRSLDDWDTFYQGGRRLTEYLKYVGYNAAIISVLRDGGSLYPSRLLNATPKYDTGTFFVDGKDPHQKDVLELLYRLFDREGLQLVPAIHFAFPLPELERLLRDKGSDPAGIEMTGIVGNPPQAVVGRQFTRRGLAPYYNPLDARVQQAIRRVVEEVAERYAHHPSFAGICLQVGPKTYLQFPDESWPCDNPTLQRFQTDAKITGPVAADPIQQCQQILRSPMREKWLAWRAEQLSALYRNVQSRVGELRPGARLYLATEGLLTSPTVRRELRPRLLARSDVSRAFLRHGVNIADPADREGIVFLRPQRQAPLTSLVAQGVNLESRQSPATDAHFRNKTIHGALNYHEPLTLSLPDFDKDSPFGAERTQTWLAAHIPPAGMHNRVRFIHSLSALDAQVLVEGGWMIPLGQEESVRSLFETYRRLPAANFRNWRPSSPSAQGSDIVVRTLTRGRQTFVYLVNDSPWNSTVHLQLENAAQCAMQPLSRRALPRLVNDGEVTTWTLELEPYDLVGAVLSAPDVVVQDWQVSYGSQIESTLDEMIDEVRGRVYELRNPKPTSVLSNPDFEVDPQGNEIPGWFHAQRPGVSVRLATDGPKQGKRCLHLSVESANTVAWVRSRPFAAPSTGRVFVLAWIRTRDGKQPPLRLAIDGLVNGEPYYRYAPLGIDVDSQNRNPTGQRAEPIPEAWSERPFLLPIDDLPSSGLSELLIGFDLMGEGEVWIDDVQVFDLYFQSNEQQELLKSVAMADLHLEKGELSECADYLDSYWPRFLLEFVPPPPRVASQPARHAPPDVDQEPRESDNQEPSSWNRFLPKIRLPFVTR